MQIIGFGQSVVLALALVGVACGHNSTGPDGRAVVRVTIGGADSVAPGQTAQLSATAVLSNGSTRIVTDVTWESSNHELMTVSQTGLVKATDARGEGQITVSYQGDLAVASVAARSAKQTLLVLPTGTYVLSGSVTDGGMPLTDVEVELTSGTGAGMAAIANPSFKFYGVAGDTEIRVTKSGYETQVRRVSVTQHQTQGFDLVPSDRREAVAGTYTLRIAAAAACAQQLPENVRSRTYTAAISQSGPLSNAVLSGADMGGPWKPANSFGGSVETGIVRFAPSRYSGEDRASTFRPPSIMEVISSSQDDTTYFTFFGSVVATPDGDGYSGTLDGSLEVITVPGPGVPWWDSLFQRQASCRSAAHQFTLRR